MASLLLAGQRSATRGCISLWRAQQSSASVCRRHQSSAGFSAAWQSVDESTSHEEQFVTTPPNPLEYLLGFDSVPAAQQYKQALLEACELQPSHRILDVGCGTATHIPHYAQAVDHVTAIDISEDLIERAKTEFTQSNSHSNVSFQVASVYQLPFASRSFHVVKEDRVLQHLNRPLEAVQEMLRVTKPGGTVVVSNPDFRSFVMDTVSPAQRWGQSIRYDGNGQEEDMADLTSKVLNGVVPTLCAHPSIGSQNPRLLRAAGCDKIEMQVVPMVFEGREDLERIVPITYMVQLSHANGAITKEEMDRWLHRLAWEESTANNVVTGTLNMYIARGIKPGDDRVFLNSIGTQFFQNLKPPSPQLDPFIRLATINDPPELIEQARNMVNNEYATSDTGVTLTSQRLRPQDIEAMVADNQLLLAFDDQPEGDGKEGRLVGCVQVKLKQASDGVKGLPSFGGGDEEVVAEFTCLAVPSNIQANVTNVNTQAVEIERKETQGNSRRGRGVGAALVRAVEAHARNHGASRMKLGILCPADHEPPYKVFLQEYYRRLGYDYHSTVVLGFEKNAEGEVVVDELHERYEELHSLVQNKGIFYEKVL